MIRRDLTLELLRAAAQSPAVTLTGPRQSGKTTLCRAFFPEHPYRTLEAPDDRAFAAEDPRAFLARFPAGAVIDEVQRLPGLLSYLQGIIDADPAPGRWILTGSQNLALLESVSQSLAGRTELLYLLPLTRDEILRFDRHPESMEEAMFTGGYPRIFDRGLDPSRWLRSYVATYIERDVRKRLVNDAEAVFPRHRPRLLAAVELREPGQTSVAPAARTTSSLTRVICGDRPSPPPEGRGEHPARPRPSSFACRTFTPTCAEADLVKMPKLYFHDAGLTLRGLSGRFGERRLQASSAARSAFARHILRELRPSRRSSSTFPNRCESSMAAVELLPGAQRSRGRSRDRWQRCGGSVVSLKVKDGR